MLWLDHVSKKFGDRSVLSDLTFKVRPGEVYGLLGPNGAGKTTTINTICNLVKPDQGSIRILDRRPVSEATKALVGIVPQENLLYRSLTCAENLHFFARIYGLSQVKRVERVYECLKLVNLLDRADSIVENLSGGMQRRLSIALALVHQPKLVILDEPTTGLDIESRYEIWDLIRLLKTQGITVLLTTHLLEEAEHLCQRIGIIKGGKLLKQGTLDSLSQCISAALVALVDTPQPDRATARAEQLGFPLRHYGRDLAFWVPQPMSLRELLAAFEGIELTSVALQPVRLEHVYLEITRSV
ncbi:ABC transporter ATP-binding protein [Prochlorothrix hollandica]|uniref:ABC transporter ATP-binding protein n=1 Tax=Prochlorothrix hollandica PCC 9006 = CALU 1027 TaxID=317619 RepID=A0A0M2PPI4_PROHO|nr:ABC transporter ATP-binding protein [Prochlorothrix hollandica]KKI98485.1 ABC transporter ATP-binding protein [Prochlorothrix hollandica PCC 9006 = CALU 1027]